VTVRFEQVLLAQLQPLALGKTHKAGQLGLGPELRDALAQRRVAPVL
jgi:hypothetical protein